MDRGAHLDLVKEYAAKGCIAASISYRLANVAAFPAQIHDAKCAIRYLRSHAESYGLDPDRIGVVGFSAGGHIAALLGTSVGVAELEGDGGWPGVSSRVHAVVDYFGPSDFPSWGAMRDYPWSNDPNDGLLMLLGGAITDRMEMARMASPVTYVSKDASPFLLIHGSKDAVVPFTQSEILRDALNKVGVEAELMTIEDGDHSDELFWVANPRKREVEFLRRILVMSTDGADRSK